MSDDKSSTTLPPLHSHARVGAVPVEHVPDGAGGR